MKYKKIIIVLFVLMGSFLFIAIVSQSFFLDVNKIHNFSDVTEFENYSQLDYYEIYDFDAFFNNGQEQILSHTKEYNIHYEDYDKKEYYFRPDQSSTEYHINYDTSNNHYIIDKEKSIKIDDAYLTYYFDESKNEYRFTVYHNNLNYIIRFNNTDNIKKDELIKIIKDYVHLNNEFHKK